MKRNKFNLNYFYFDTLIICRPFGDLKVICLPVFTNMLVPGAFLSLYSFDIGKKQVQFLHTKSRRDVIYL